MTDPHSIDGVLVQWGDRLFYPGNRIVKGQGTPRLTGRNRAAAIRDRIAAAVRRAPQVMVKVTGGGRGMKAIAAHFKYISKHGRLVIEDERGEKSRGKEELRDLLDDWRLGGSLIEEVSPRREALNIMLSMPRGTDPLAVQRAAREFAKIELADHKYVMVLHDHQANPHVHLSVRAESMQGQRLNPRKADLRRWREVFAEQLRELGIDAEATRQATRGQSRGYLPLWRIKAREEGRERKTLPKWKARATIEHSQAVEAWEQIARALSTSSEPTDRRLALDVAGFLKGETRPRDQEHRLVTGPERDLQPQSRSQGRTR
jgi:hypothetical protein